MLKQNKKSPAYTDTDKMPFGKFKDELLKNVPASYLVWLKEEGCNNIKLANYIYNSWDAIQQELGDKE